MTGWWYTATRSQKLAQIDGGIECGMTAKQIAMVCGSSEHAVRYFANSHDRHFGGLTKAGLQRIIKTQKRIWAERRGEIPQDAFTIFDTGEHTPSLELEF